MTDNSLTRCPKCQTCFRVTSAQLKKAKGKVRCGHCSHVFLANAHQLPATASSDTGAVTQPPKTKPVTPPAPRNIPPTKPARQPHNDYFDLAAAPKPEVPPPPKTSASSPPAFIDSIIDDRSRYNNLDTLGNIEIPGDIQIDLSPTQRKSDTDTKTTPPSSGSPAPAKPNKPSGNRTYEDKDSSDTLPTPGDIAAIEALYEAATAEVDRTVRYPQPSEEIVLSGGVAETPDQQPASPLADKAAARDVDSLPDSFLTNAHDLDTTVAHESPRGKKTEQHDWVMPFSLRSDLSELEPSERPLWLKSLLLTLMIVMLLLLGFQFALFRNSQLVNRFPALKAPMSWFCAYAPCRYTGGRDVEKIHLLNRDIRSHPNAKNALLITVSMANQAEFNQPYPTILLSLYNLSGDIVARRRFTPAEYLDKLYHPFLLMESGTPVHVTLAVIDPGEDAMNFEFSFH